MYSLYNVFTLRVMKSWTHFKDWGKGANTKWLRARHAVCLSSQFNVYHGEMYFPMPIVAQVFLTCPCLHWFKSGVTHQS